MMTEGRVTLTIDGVEVTVDAGTTLLDACGGRGGGIPTLCYGETITPKNACRVCMVEVEGSRTLVPACSRPVEAGMVVRTRSERVDHSRRMVLELLDSSVDLSLTGMLLVTPNSLRTGTTIRLRLPAQGRIGPLDFTGRVIWSKPTSKTGLTNTLLKRKQISSTQAGLMPGGI